MTALGFTQPQIKPALDRATNLRLGERLPLLGAKAQTQELFSDRIVPGLNPGTPLPKAYQTQAAPVEIQEMLKRSAEAGK